MLTPKITGLLERNFKNIGTLPTVISSLIRILNDPKSSARDLGRVISVDQVLSARLLRLVNSAYFGLRKEVIDINQAVSLVGYNLIRSFTFCISLFDNMDFRGTHMEFSKEKFWIHSLSVGSLARRTAAKLRIENPADYFVAGVIHDIGKIFVYQFMPDVFYKVLEKVQNESIPFYQAENALIGSDHSEIGSWVMSRWDMPELLVDCIKYHHHEVTTNDNLIASEIVALADNMAKDCNFGSSGDKFVSPEYELLKYKYQVQSDWIAYMQELVSDEVKIYSDLIMENSEKNRIYQ